jgi:hypothetical protein
MSEDRAHHPARKVGREEHAGRTKATTRIFPPRDSGLVNDQRLDKGTALFAAAPEHRGEDTPYGETQHVIPNASMPGVKAKFKDMRRGTNNTGANPGNYRLSSKDARAHAIEEYQMPATKIQDNEGNHVPNQMGNPPLY